MALLHPNFSTQATAVSASAVSSSAHQPIPNLTAGALRSILYHLHYLPFTVDKTPHKVSYHWRFPVPPVLSHLVAQYAWTDPFNPWVLGALYQFERVHGLPIDHGKDGILGLPHTILKALRHAKTTDPHAWTWVLVTKQPEPETIRIFVAHRGWVFRSVCNTGVLHSTPDGTWPIYARALHTTMVGEFPIPVTQRFYRLYRAAVSAGFHVPIIHFGDVNGYLVRYQPYDDPDIRWVNYFYQGRAVHYFPRASYGFPQSAGCVELPKPSARKAFTILHYGVPVTILTRVKASFLALPKPHQQTDHSTFLDTH